MSHVGNRMVAWGGALALLWLGGCASQRDTRPPPEQISQAYKAVWAARAHGADRDGRAAPFLTAAERQLLQARHSLDTGHNRDARWQLARAAADGQLSEALTQRSAMEREVARSERRLAEARAAAQPVRAE